jgi:hypothetical protein
MKMIVALGFGAFFVSSLAIGIRLVWLARRNHGLPELLIGLGILGIGPVGFAFTIFAMLLGAGHSELVFALLAIGQLAIAAGALSAYTFNWQVFRRGSRAAQAIVVVAAIGFGVTFVGRWLSGGYSLPVRTDAWMLSSSVNVVVCMMWGSLESLRYYALMRRRARLGLSEPLLVNRFLLWGLGIGAAGVGTLVGSVWMWLGNAGARELDGATLSNSLFGLTSAVCMWMAFLPPAPYRRWIERRAGAAAAMPAA